jgi:hypothetical protein
VKLNFVIPGKNNRGDQVITLAHGTLLAAGPSTYNSYEIPSGFGLISIRNNLVTKETENFLREKKFMVYLLFF